MSILSDEINNDPEGVGYSGLSDEQAAASLNANSTPAHQPIEKQAIREYLRVKGLWLLVKRSPSDAAELAMDSITEPGSYDFANPIIRAAVSGILQGIADDAAVPGFTVVEKAEILAMGDTLISRAQELNIRVEVADIQKIRGTA